MNLYLMYMLDLWSFVVIKLPEDGTTVPKHVGVGTWRELCFTVFHCILRSAFSG
jgi:hypothetical protein